MNSVLNLEKAARDQRIQFDKTLGEVKRRSTFSELGHEALSLINLRDKAPPVIAGSIVATAAWIFSKILGRKKRRSIPATKTPNVEQEKSHEIRNTSRS
jgi:hypothetical protein